MKIFRKHQGNKKSSRKEILGRAFLPFMLLFAVACSSIDCPLNNIVRTQYKLAGNVTTLAGPLTISTDIKDGNDSVIINQQVNTDSFFLPISYQRPQDAFYVKINHQSGTQTIDTITVAKEDRPHFESVDCSPSIFHTIKGVTSTHHAIDSIIIHNPNVTYDANKAHFLIYFKSRVD